MESYVGDSVRSSGGGVLEAKLVGEGEGGLREGRLTRGRERVVHACSSARLKDRAENSFVHWLKKVPGDMLGYRAVVKKGAAMYVLDEVAGAKPRRVVAARH